jgi:hypothetical protein
MKNKFFMSVATVILCFSALTVSAQQQRDDRKKENADAINTKKKTPVKYIENIVGTWKTGRVLKNDKDISNTDTVGTDQVIEFNREGRYVSHSGNEKIDSGAYRLNEDHGILYLESETGEPIAQWNIQFDNDRMILQPRETNAHAESFKYIYTRASGGNSGND